MVSVKFLCLGFIYSFALYFFVVYIDVCIFLQFYTNFIGKEMKEKIESYDYIIIGCGSAGSVIASRLAEDNDSTVLVLEAGILGGSALDIPVISPFIQLSNFDWQYRTVPQKNACMAMKGNVSYWPMGRLVGGTGRLNNMVYLRGHRNDYDQWYDVDYNYEKDILPYFKKAEEIQGPCEISDLPFVSGLAEKFLEAVKSLGYSVGNINGKYGTGFMQARVNLRNGARFSTAHHLLERPRPNLTLLTNAVVEKVLLKGNYEAYAVKYSHLGETKYVKVKRAIILSAGVIGTPKILMLSGIGPKKHLSDIGISTKLDLPVGENLQDHVTTGLDLVILNQSLSIDLANMMSPFSAYKYFFQSDGPWTSAGCEVVGTLDTEDKRGSDRNNRTPDLQFMVVPTGVSADGGRHLRKIVNINDGSWYRYFEHTRYSSTVSILPIVLHPKSRGTVRLFDKHPTSRPEINPNYLSDLYDVEILLRGIELIKEIIQTTPMQQLGAKLNAEKFPGCENFDFDSRPYWQCYVRHLTLTSYHPVGTTKMGARNDNAAVVGYDFKVLGTNRLYVADASVMPSLPSGNINAVVAMIAEKAAASIKHDAYLDVNVCDVREIFIRKIVC